MNRKELEAMAAEWRINWTHQKEVDAFIAGFLAGRDAAALLAWEYAEKCDRDSSIAADDIGALIKALGESNE